MRCIAVAFFTYIVIPRAIRLVGISHIAIKIKEEDCHGLYQASQ